MSASASQPTIRVLLAEDQGMVLGALAALLRLENDIDVVAQVTNGADAIEAVRQHCPDILITDIEMPRMSGLEVAQRVRQQYDTRVIVLTTFARAGYLRQALEAGVSAYLLKARPARELADAVRSVHRGIRVIDPKLAAEAWGGRDPLTDREREALRLTTEGISTAAIAERLHLSAGTVRNHLSEAIAKLGAKNRHDAARIARSKGWL